MKGRSLLKLLIAKYDVAQDQLQTKVGGNTENGEEVKNRNKLGVNRKGKAVMGKILKEDRILVITAVKEKMLGSE